MPAYACVTVPGITGPKFENFLVSLVTQEDAFRKNCNRVMGVSGSSSKDATKWEAAELVDGLSQPQVNIPSQAHDTDVIFTKRPSHL